MENYNKYASGGGATGETGSFRAFTLAEVLLTLAIIGIVAALTIPVLLNKYQEKVLVTKLVKFYSNFNNAYMLNLADGNEVPKSVDILKHVKVHKICEKTYSGCSESKYFNLNNTVTAWGASDSFAVSYAILSDGVIIRYFDRAACNIHSYGEGLYSCGEISVDINGESAPNTIGKDVFFFYLTPKKGLVPFGTNIDTLNTFEDNCVKDQIGHACTAWVLENKNLDYLHCPNDLSWSGKRSCNK